MYHSRKFIRVREQCPKIHDKQSAAGWTIIILLMNL